jgi:hypothetical protein
VARPHEHGLSGITEAFLTRPVRPWTLAAALWLNLALLAATFFAGIITLLQTVVRQRGTFFGDDPVMSLPPTGLTAPGIAGLSFLLLLLTALLIIARGWTRALYVIFCAVGSVLLVHNGVVLAPAIYVLLSALIVTLTLLFLPASQDWFNRP